MVFPPHLNFTVHLGDILLDEKSWITILSHRYLDVHSSKPKLKYHFLLSIKYWNRIRISQSIKNANGKAIVVFATEAQWTDAEPPNENDPRVAWWDLVLLPLLEFVTSLP